MNNIAYFTSFVYVSTETHTIYCNHKLIKMQTDASPSARIAQELRQGIVTLSRRLRATQSEVALSSMSLSILSRLHRGGETTPSALAAQEHMQPQSLTRVLAALEEHQLIERAPDPGDGRRVLVRITKAGRIALRDDAKLKEVWLAAAIEKLSPTEREVLRLAGELMRQMVDA